MCVYACVYGALGRVRGCLEAAGRNLRDNRLVEWRRVATCRAQAVHHSSSSSPLNRSLMDLDIREKKCCGEAVKYDCGWCVCVSLISENNNNKKAMDKPLNPHTHAHKHFLNNDDDKEIPLWLRHCAEATKVTTQNCGGDATDSFRFFLFLREGGGAAVLL